jgi:23S rRNA G2445 N2-methylase RlmL
LNPMDLCKQAEDLCGSGNISITSALIQEKSPPKNLEPFQPDVLRIQFQQERLVYTW